MSAALRQLLMPKLGLTMTEGMVSKWEVAEGQRFAAGDVLVVVESEKTAIEVDAPAAGVLGRILVQESATVPVGTLLAHWQLDAQGAAAPAADGAEAGPEAATASAVTATTAPVGMTVTAPFTMTATAPVATTAAASVPTATLGPASAPAAAVPPETRAAPAGGRLLTTPLARRMARDAGVELAGIVGTGPRGRIHAADVKAAMAGASSRPMARTATAAAAPVAAGSVRVPTGIERTMAARVTAAKRDIPHFYLTADIDVGPLLELRRSLNGLGGRRRVSMTHLMVAAVVWGLKAVPRMNTVWADDGHLTHARIDVGIAVDTDRGLMSPVVRDLGGDGLYAMAARIDEVIDRARRGALSPADQGGGAITVSNAGMHRVHYMTSIIVPGQSAILGIGAVQDCFRPDAEGAPTLRRELGVVLSVDHRVHTGVGALEFLKFFEQAVMEPLRLLS